MPRRVDSKILIMSPSSRRAWIEIFVVVDAQRELPASPSSRRAWIEMRQRWSAAHRQSVALLAEGVDRNIVAIDQFDFLECRPPRGEHTSNPLSIRLHSLSFLQAGHRFGGQQPFSMQTSGGTAFCEPAAGLFRVSSLLQAPTVQTAEDAARRGEHIGHLIFLHDSGQIPAVAVITQQADPAELCCKVHLFKMTISLSSRFARIL